MPVLPAASYALFAITPPTSDTTAQSMAFIPAATAGSITGRSDQINNLFHLRRDHIPADQYRAARTQAFQAWAEVTGMAALA